MHQESARGRGTRLRNARYLDLGIPLQIVITASLLGRVFLSGLKKQQRFPNDRWAECFVVRVKGGCLAKAAITPEGQEAVLELVRLRYEGIIFEKEHPRKLRELGG